jgi:DNA-binding NtrC family response regulator
MARAKILLADNDPAFLDTRSEYLEREGYTVIRAASPSKARDKLVNEKPDLAILDIRLENDDDEKDISGLLLAQEIGRLVPVLLLTGYPSVEYVRQALKPQSDGLPAAYDFVAKQDGPEALLIAVQNTLQIAENRKRVIVPSKGDTQEPQTATSKNLPSRILAAVFMTIPRVVGRTTLDLFGRYEAVDSTAIMLGYIIIAVGILVLLGIVDLDKVVGWFVSWWRFFFPAK